jgi:peroxiredoxin
MIKMSKFSGLKLKCALSFLTTMMLLGPFAARAQDLNNAAGIELRGLVDKVNDQLKTGTTNEADFTDQIKSLDAFSAKYAQTDPDNAALALYMKAMVYIQGLNDHARGAEVLKELKAKFPDTKAGRGADHVLAVLASQSPPPAQAPAQNTNTATNIDAEINRVVTSINAKIMAGKNTEADFADEMKSYDAILAEHAGEKTEAVAAVLVAKAQFFGEVFNDAEKALEAYKQLKRDFPDTKAGKEADQAITDLEDMVAQQKALQKIKDGLVPGTKFPDFQEKDLAGNPISISQYKGKVVLVDFWATWCPICVVEMPNTLKVYQKYHDQGFDVVGVSMDDDQPLLKRYLKEHDIPWRQAFEGVRDGNQMSIKYATDYLPTYYLLDRDGKIIATDRSPDTIGMLNGDKLDKAVAAALAKQ